MLRYAIAAFATLAAGPVAAEPASNMRPMTAPTNVLPAAAPTHSGSMPRKIIAHPVRTIERRDSAPIGASYIEYSPAPNRDKVRVPMQSINAVSPAVVAPGSFETGDIGSAPTRPRLQIASQIRFSARYAACVLDQIESQTDGATIEIDMNACR